MGLLEQQLMVVDMLKIQANYEFLGLYKQQQMVGVMRL